MAPTLSRFSPTSSKALAAAALFAAAGCAVGPEYHQPSAPAPAAYREAAGWKPAAPNDDAIRGTWWSVFQDPTLDRLESQAGNANASLQVAAANYEQARHLARATHTGFFPTVDVTGSAQRNESYGGRGGGSRQAASNFSAALGATWTPDFWGRVRRQTEAAVASAQTSAADLALARLSIQTAVARNYIELRIAEERLRLRQDAVTTYSRTLAIAQNKYKAGVVTRADVLSAQVLVNAARAAITDPVVQRAQFEHAVAVLVGQAPGEFVLAPLPALNFTMPAVPPQVPAQLLERRPDIAGAERSVAVANAQIGLETAAYFPDLSLSADGGFQGSPLSDLFRAPNRFWAIGASLGTTLLDFGRRGAALDAARAAFDARAAGYRLTVLSAFQEVEDNLTALQLYTREGEIQAEVVTEAADAARIALNEYNAGTVDFTTVVTAQVTELNNRQTALTIYQERLLAAVALIEALGGGWTTHDLPSADQVFKSGSAAESSAKK